MKKSFYHKKPFSLIELLVVFAIVLVLISLLSPSLKKMTYHARQLDCFSNLRNMGFAIGVYLSENDDIFMDHRRGGYHNWHDHLLNLGLEEEDFKCQERGEEWVSRVNPNNTYPVVTKTVPGTRLSALHLMPYGYNGFWLGISPYYTPTTGPLGRNFTKLSDVRLPNKMIAISDSNISAGDTWASSIWYTNKFSNEGVSAVHSENSSILFVDGHASAEIAQEVNQNPEWDPFWKPHHQ